MFQLIFNSLLLGIGLAMDAFSVSIANGIVESGMRKRRMLAIAGVYAAFQFLMPMLGWILVTTLEEIFTKFSILIPWIALILLLFIGGKMIWDAFHEDDELGEEAVARLSLRELLLLAIATSIDALAVGVTVAFLDVSIVPAVALIGVTTFVISFGGVVIGHQFGSRWEKASTIAGGIILICIGIKIVLDHFLG